jgi:hypothetical protein
MIMIPLVTNLLVLTSKDVTEEDIEQLESTVLNFEYTRQSGKTTSIVHIVESIMLFVTRLFGIPIEIGIFAPQREQANTDFKRLKNALSRSRKDLIIVDHEANQQAKEESNAKTITLGNGSSCYIFPVTPASKPESKTLHVIIIEEAQDINDEIVDEDILPMGTATNAVVVKVGTAGDKKCVFYKDIQKGRAYVMTAPEISADRRRMFNMDGDARHLVYEQNVKQKIERHGLMSPEIQKPYFNVWQLSGGMFIDSHHLIAGRVQKVFDNPGADPIFREYREWYKAGRRSLPQCDEWAMSHNIPTEVYEQYRAWLEQDHYFGIDTAKSTDQTILKIGRMINGKLTIVRSVGGMHGTNYEDQFDTLVDELQWFKIAAGSIDSTGQGDFMPDKFERHTPYKVYRLKFSRMSKDIIYKALYQKMINGNLCYYWQDVLEYPVKAIAPGTKLSEEQATAKDAEEFEDEFIDLEKRYIGDLMVVAHPDSGEAHDDHPDATALMNYAYDSYNISSGIRQHYQNEADERAKAEKAAAIASANQGA